MNFKNIKAVAFDFDGVFTDNRVIVIQNGDEAVICNRSDGLGLSMLKKLDLPMVIISSEKNPVVLTRAKKLDIPVKFGVSDKTKSVNSFAKSNNVNLHDIAFVGNDINDVECMKKVGYPIAVSDAFEEVKFISKYVLDKKGGHGAVRELCELIYKSKI